MTRNTTDEELRNAAENIRHGSTIARQSKRLGVHRKTLAARLHAFDPDLRSFLARRQRTGSGHPPMPERKRMFTRLIWMYDREEISADRAAAQLGVTRPAFVARAAKLGVRATLPNRSPLLDDIIASILDGADFEELADLFDVTRNTARRWIFFYNNDAERY